MPLTPLIPTLQLAIGPAILISGVGLILLSMTNRFGRLIDRSRQLADEQRAAPADEQARLREQVRILAARARMLRAGILSGVFSVLLAALLVISLFVGALLQLEISTIIACEFVLCLVALIICLVYFIADINLSLHALWLEIPEARGKH